MEKMSKLLGEKIIKVGSFCLSGKLVSYITWLQGPVGFAGPDYASDGHW